MNNSTSPAIMGETNGTASLLECHTDLSKAELPLLLIFSVILDSLSILILFRIRSSSNPVNNFLVTTLAGNDFVTSLLFIVMWSGNVAVCGKFGGKVACSILGWAATTMVIWSAWVVVVMSGVRYLSVVKPIYYKTTLTLFGVKCGLVGTLVFASVSLIFPFTGLIPPYKMYTENFICAYDFAPGAGGKFHRALVGFLAGTGLSTVGVVLYFNGRIIYELRRKRAIIPTRQATSTSTATDKRSSFANMTKVVAAVYCICYGPFLSRLLYDVILNSPDQNGIRHSVTMLLLFLCPLLNPFVYAACNKRFRQYVWMFMKTLSVKLRCVKPDNSSEPANSDTGSRSQTTKDTRESHV